MLNMLRLFHIDSKEGAHNVNDDLHWVRNEALKTCVKSDANTMKTGKTYHSDQCNLETNTIDTFFTTFLGSEIGKIIVQICQVLGIVIIIGAIVSSGWKLWKGQGGGGGSSFISGLLMPLVAGALLFNLSFAGKAIGFIAQLIFNMLSSVTEIIPGLG